MLDSLFPALITASSGALITLVVMFITRLAKVEAMVMALSAQQDDIRQNIRYIIERLDDASQTRPR
jgi:hypothetical protein